MLKFIKIYIDPLKEKKVYEKKKLTFKYHF